MSGSASCRRTVAEGGPKERDVRTVCLLYGCQCNACCARIEKALRHVRGVREVEVNFYKATAMVEHDESCPCERLIDAIERIGYLATVAAPGSGGGTS